MDVAIARGIRSLALHMIHRKISGLYAEGYFFVDMYALAKVMSRCTRVFGTVHYYRSWMRYYHWLERNRTAILNGGIGF